MGLQEQDFTLNFAGQVDTKSDPNQIDPHNFLSMSESVFTVGGRLTKRNGFPSLGTTINPTAPVALTYSNLGSNITSAKKVFSYENELCLNDGFNLYSYDESNNGWNYKGRSTINEVTTENIAQDIYDKTNMDMSIDTTTGVKIYAWYLDGGFTTVQYSIQDIKTGQFIVNKALFGGAATYQTPRCVSISGMSWIFAVNTSDGKIYYQEIIGQTVTGAVVPLVSDLNATEQFYDVDYVDGNIYIAYFTTGPAIKIAQLSSSMTVVNSITKSESATNGLSFFGDGTNIWIVYNNGTDTKAFIVNNSVTATVLDPTIVDAGSGAANVLNVTGAWSSTQNLAFIFYDQSSIDIRGFVHNRISYNTLTVGGTAGTAETFMRSVILISKAFSISGIPHVCTLFSSPSSTTLQDTYFLLNLYNVTGSMGSASYADVTANIAAKIAADQAGAAGGAGYLCSVHNSIGQIWDIALGEKTQLQSATSATVINSVVGVIDCQIDFSLSNPDVQVLGTNAHIASGEVIMYDGSSVVEQNFHIFPEGVTGSSSTGSGGGLGNSSVNTLYSYQITYEWADNEGQLHRSSPSPVLTIINGTTDGYPYTFSSGTTNGKISLIIPTLRVTNKSGSQVTINVYRTVGNGTVYYQVGDPLLFTVLNDPQEDTVTYTDVTTDANLVLGIQLYTTGELEDFAAPASIALTTFKNRILYVPSEGAYQFGYSKQVQVGFPVEFVPEFIQNIGTVAGPLTCIAGMDDKIILFKSGLSVGPSILYMVGTGPAASGANNDFTDPLPVAVDVGCVDRASVVLTPNGLIFKSDKGIYLLDRGLNASYIGAAIEGYNQYDVLSAQLIPNTTQVRFILSNGVMIMYDYFYQKWATFNPPAGISDCIFQGQHTYVSATGIVYKESPGVYYDGVNTPILRSFTTAPFNFASITGYERVKEFHLLGNYISSHQLQLTMNYDYAGYPQQQTTITPNPTKPLEQWRVHTKQQLCQAFQLTLNEVFTGTLGAGFTLTGITFKIFLKSSNRPISGASSSGMS